MQAQDVDPLIITVTVDSIDTWPGNPHCPPVDDVPAVAEEYIAGVDAGASIAHIHGVHHVDEEIQSDGRKLSRVDYEGWQELHDRIKDGCDVNPIMQYGIASARLDEKFELMKQDPEMMAYAFHAHDEYSSPSERFDEIEPTDKEPIEVYAIHPRDEIAEFLKGCLEYDVKPEVEAFHTGGFYNLTHLRKEGLLENPVWTTLFFGWPGGTWTPPTTKSLINFVDHLPENCNWNVSCMDPVHAWDIYALAIMHGGHVRVGWEDNPYLDPNDLSPENLARTNRQLVEKLVDLAELLGRDIATPDQAREIIGIA